MVFCKGCKHNEYVVFNDHAFDDTNGVSFDNIDVCHCPTNLKTVERITHREIIISISRKETPAEKNKNNSCKDYEKKKRWRL